MFELVEDYEGKSMPVAEWSRLGGAMLSALSSFHELGIIHRDVKVSTQLHAALYRTLPGASPKRGYQHAIMPLELSS